ncbi:hypothetical protein I6J24_01290 [Corynebacterium kroppenstedtii]|uniref:hypothetical protein n=1 Tax=Corynebacterium pseudokroppenstedtii TaxID=2804917 RepID=UPI00194F2A9D|nr:hypothetical protein [Corynebacterium pseudokroppenstedtii]MDK7148455.1 hypothetical protein [Corynebacterium pseudokroppenstedtii]QRP14700.1 hypothetical protein I6J24_01290 [Corynebacterium kroppenstedtii]
MASPFEGLEGDSGESFETWRDLLSVFDEDLSDDVFNRIVESAMSEFRPPADTSVLPNQDDDYLDDDVEDDAGLYDALDDPDSSEGEHASDTYDPDYLADSHHDFDDHSYDDHNYDDADHDFDDDDIDAGYDSDGGASL